MRLNIGSVRPDVALCVSIGSERSGRQCGNGYGRKQFHGNSPVVVMVKLFLFEISDSLDSVRILLCVFILMAASINKRERQRIKLAGRWWMLNGE